MHRSLCTACRGSAISTVYIWLQKLRTQEALQEAESLQSILKQDSLVGLENCPWLLGDTDASESIGTRFGRASWQGDRDLSPSAMRRVL